MSCYIAFNLDERETLSFSTVNLSQASFTPGTLRITQPGRYVLQENVTFNPNPPQESSSKRGGARSRRSTLEPYDAYHRNIVLVVAEISFRILLDQKHVA